jgi:hypothetical protein
LEILPQSLSGMSMEAVANLCPEMVDLHRNCMFARRKLMEDVKTGFIGFASEGKPGGRLKRDYLWAGNHRIRRIAHKPRNRGRQTPTA